MVGPHVLVSISPDSDPQNGCGLRGKVSNCVSIEKKDKSKRTGEETMRVQPTLVQFKDFKQILSSTAL